MSEVDHEKALNHMIAARTRWHKMYRDAIGENARSLRTLKDLRKTAGILGTKQPRRSRRKVAP
jgi:hypothetical protein